MNAVETFELSKQYSRGRVKALQDCSLQVETGKIFSLLGPNGAGKTTLLKILMSIVHPSSGDAKILNHPSSDYTVHSRIGYLAENHRFPEFLTAGQVLRYYGRMSGIPDRILNDKIRKLLETVKLKDWIDVKIRKFSKGMMQRLGLAHALINDPDLLFLDEPTDGIDPIGRREIRDILKKLRDQGKTIFLNSHLLSEVERMSDEVAILKNGRLLQRGNVNELISLKQQYQVKLGNGPEEMKSICLRLKIPLTMSDGLYNISVKDDLHLNQWIDALRENSVLLQALIPRKISLEDYFIDVIENTGKEAQ